MDLLRCVVAPAIRMALKLHQDHFTAGDDFDDAVLLYERITHHLTRLFISHEVSLSIHTKIYFVDFFDFRAYKRFIL